MRRIDRPEGLVRFDSRRAFDGKGRRSFWRPRVLAYLALALIGLSVATFTAMRREAFQANLLRTRGLPYELEGERIRNLYQLHLQNKSDQPIQLDLVPHQDPGSPVEYLIPQPEVSLEGMEDADVPIYLYLDRSSYEGSFPVGLTVINRASGEKKEITMRFKGP
jgi:hypothetical protein